MTDVEVFIAGIPNPTRQRDARTLLEIMMRVTGEQAELIGTGIGFGSYHYRYASGREGDAPAAGFAPRTAATTVYLMDGVGAHRERLERLGPHRAATGCIYLTNLERNDLGVLEQIIAESYATLTADTYRRRARESG